MPLWGIYNVNTSIRESVFLEKCLAAAECSCQDSSITLQSSPVRLVPAICKGRDACSSCRIRMLARVTTDTREAHLRLKLARNDDGPRRGKHEMMLATFQRVSTMEIGIQGSRCVRTSVFNGLEEELREKARWTRLKREKLRLGWVVCVRKFSKWLSWWSLWTLADGRFCVTMIGDGWREASAFVDS